MDRYELYRVVTDMDALHEAFRDRAEDLQTTRLELDAAGELQPGYSAKLLCNPPMKSFGRQSLPGMLKATGMVLVLVVDDERFAPIKEQLGRRKRPMRSIVRMKRPRWLLTPQKASKISKNRWENVPPEIRKKMMKKLAKASWRARRAKQRKSIEDTRSPIHP